MINQYIPLDKIIKAKIIKKSANFNADGFKINDVVFVLGKNACKDRYYVSANEQTMTQTGYMDKECLNFNMIGDILKQL